MMPFMSKYRLSKSGIYKQETSIDTLVIGPEKELFLIHSLDTLERFRTNMDIVR